MNALASILAHKRRELAARQPDPARSTARANSPKMDFLGAISTPGVSVIAEIKRRSPSGGIVREGVDVADIAGRYRLGGAAALSVLTDHQFFGGTNEDLPTAKRAASLPVLRKDFVIDATQIQESVHLGADAVLLIVAALSDGQLREFVSLTQEVGLDALVEVHSERELERALSAGAVIIGVNNRDLATMQVDLNVCLNLRRHIPGNCAAVAESGVRSREDVRRLHDNGYNTFLVGEMLMAAADPARRLMELTGRVLPEEDVAVSRAAGECGK